MNKGIFIYYSLSGNGDIISDYLKEKGYSVLKIKTKEELPNNFLLRILVGGYKAMINYNDEIEEFICDINSFDNIIIGSPIWNDRLSTPINSVLKRINLGNKNITFILYSGKGKNKKAYEYIISNYDNSNIINIKEPKKFKEELKKLDNL